MEKQFELQYNEEAIHYSKFEEFAETKHELYNSIYNDYHYILCKYPFSVYRYICHIPLELLMNHLNCMKNFNDTTYDFWVRSFYKTNQKIDFMTKNAPLLK